MKRVFIVDRIEGVIYEGDDTNHQMSLKYQQLKEDYEITNKDPRKSLLEWYDKEEDIKRLEEIYIKGRK